MKQANSKRDQDHFRGCLLGGALGDALGYAVEFMRLEDIKQRYGPPGINLLPEPTLISDDTQMTMFTAEGLLRANLRYNERGICHSPSVVHEAYLRWLHTQGEVNEAFAHVFDRKSDDGWLIKLDKLHHRRAPGLTCLSALLSPRFGTMAEPLNNSKGCGGVMRVAPVGLVVDDPFQLGCEIAALTHGHPTGYLPAGVLAAIISEIISGAELEPAIEKALQQLRTYEGHQATLKCVELALDLNADVASCYAHEKNIRRIGEGWVAEEALAIALYSALIAEGDFLEGICVAVNHDGDSDSTGAITGNILGAYLGASALPAKWIEKLELNREITELADDLLQGYSEDAGWREKYPGW